jgi:hypothetical protein
LGTRCEQRLDEESKRSDCVEVENRDWLKAYSSVANCKVNIIALIMYNGNRSGSIDILKYFYTYIQSPVYRAQRRIMLHQYRPTALVVH